MNFPEHADSGGRGFRGRSTVPPPPALSALLLLDRLFLLQSLGLQLKARHPAASVQACQGRALVCRVQGHAGPGSQGLGDGEGASSVHAAQEHLEEPQA